jgi:aspartate aminotransferase-like enzyme
MLSEGLPNIFARHARVAQMTRNGIKSLGLSLFSQESHSSNTVTAVKGNDKLDIPKLIQVLRDEYDVVVAGGQRKLSGEILRIGHLGLVEESDVIVVLEALSKALPKAGFIR